MNYKKDYVAVNKTFVGGSVKLVPVFNNLVKVSEMRAYEMQQTDYASRFTVFNELKKVGTADVDNEVVREFLSNYDSLKSNKDKLRYLCEHYHLPEFDVILSNISTKRFDEYINVLGVEVCKSVGYKIEELNKKLSIQSFDKSIIREKVLVMFEIDKSYSKANIKSILSDLYKELGYKATAKANDLGEYFDIKSCLMSEGDKRVNGFKILGKK